MFGFSSFPDADGIPGRGRRAKVDTKFYDILGVTKDCSNGDLKTAYKKLAVKYHPDKGGDPDKFKDVAKAYEILSDPEKRKIYDERGEEGLDSQGGADATDIFEMFFGGGRRPKPTGPRKGEDVVSHMKVTLEQIYNGCTRKLAINRDMVCEKCDGIGGAADAMCVCATCNGQGVHVAIKRMGPMIQQTQSMCPCCKGQGKVMPESCKCKACNGLCTTKERHILEVKVMKGAANHHKISFSGMADHRPGELPGDVHIVIDQQEHSTFKRRGSDLYMSVKISLYEALTGFAILVTHLDGRRLVVKNNPGEITRPRDMKAVREEGMPINGNEYSKGNLFIVFDVLFPDAPLDIARREILGQVLERPDRSGINEDDENTEVHFTVDIDPEESNRRCNSHKEAYEEDDDGEEGGGNTQGMQCRQQ